MGAVAASPVTLLRTAGHVLHALALVCVALVLWRLLSPVRTPVARGAVRGDGTLDTPVASLLRAASDTVEVSLQGAPGAHDRALLRALRGSGHVLRLRADSVLPALAVSAESEWRASGGTRVLVVGAPSERAAVGDAAGLVDSLTLDSAGARRRTGPIEGVLDAGVARTRARVAPLVASAPVEARVFVAGAATWESRFLVAALEEAGWPVDAAFTLSPKVTVGQGTLRAPSRARHAIAIVLPGASSAAVGAVPAFVRGGGSAVIVGEASRLGGLAGVRAGVPGATLTGEAGAEAGDEPRHGLDLVPITSLAAGAVALESRDGRVAVAARRIGTGRVVQVGYDNSWLWRMAGNDDAPAAHRRWWSTLLSGIVPLRQPVRSLRVTHERDTLDAAPLAALARDIGLPAVQPARIERSTPSDVPIPGLPWLVGIATLSFVASWILRRLQGLA